MNGQLGLDLGFFFLSSHHRKVMGVDGGKGVGLLDHFPRPGYQRLPHSIYTFQLAF